MIKNIIREQKEFFLTHQTQNIEFRIKKLKLLKNVIQNNLEIINDAVYKDLKKSKAETYITEVGYCLDSINYILKNLHKWIKTKKVRGSKLFPFSKGYIIYEPLGTVLIIGSWNYPFNLNIIPLIGAIAAGNCSIIKPSEISSHTSQVIYDIISKNFSSNFIYVALGDEKKAQEILNEKLDYIFFTGSKQTGQKVMSQAVKYITPLTLELGGKNPCIINDFNNISKISRRIIWGKFLNAGQTCIAPDYLLVKKGLKKQLINSFKEILKEFYGENSETSSDYSRIVNKKHFDRLKKYLENANILYGGRTNEKNLFIEPTIIDQPKDTDPISNEEIFGPILPICEYEDIDDLILLLNKKPKPLSLYIFSNDKIIQNKIMNNTSSGNVCINDSVIQFSAKELPFGGVGESGFGQYHGKASFEIFSNQKSVLKQSSFLDITLRYPPFSKNKISRIKKFIG